MYAVHVLTGLTWGWSAFAAFIGWPLLGTIVTLDDDAPGGWSNLDGKQRPTWRTPLFWIQIFRNLCIVTSISALDAALRSRGPIVFVVGAAVALFAAGIL